MRRLPFLSVLALALVLPPGAAGFVAEPPSPPPAAVAVHPVDARTVGYGEEAARFGGPRAGRVHEGQDVFAPAGTPLVAVRDGVVVAIGSDGGRGNFVELYSPREDETYLYFHMLRPAGVDAGERVRAGDRLGAVGCTGSCWGDHLHFEVHAGRGPDGRALDPLPMLRRLPRP